MNTLYKIEGVKIMKKICLSLMISFVMTTTLFASAEEKLLDSSNALKNMIYDSKIKELGDNKELAKKKDILMIFQTKDSIQKLMNNKITLGADASVAAGPAGESAGRGSELDFKSEVYTYTKTEGAFVGVSIDGSVMNHDYDQNIELYGNNITPAQIVESDGLISSYAVEEFLKAIQKLTR